jgi:hypothetical protein
MYVVKRDGRKEAVSFDKITSRIKRLSWGLPNEFCDPVRSLALARPAFASFRACNLSLSLRPRPAARRHLRADARVRRCCARCRQVIVAQKVTAGVYKGVTTSELDELAAETAASMTSHHPDYAVVRWQRWLQHCVACPCGALRLMRGARACARSWRRASRCPTCTRTRSSRSPRRACMRLRASCCADADAPLLSLRLQCQDAVRVHQPAQRPVGAARVRGGARHRAQGACSRSLLLASARASH